MTIDYVNLYEPPTDCIISVTFYTLTKTVTSALYKYNSCPFGDIQGEHLLKPQNKEQTVPFHCASATSCNCK